MLWPAFEGAQREREREGGDAAHIAKVCYSSLTLTFIHLLTRFSTVSQLIAACPVGANERFCLGVKEMGRLRDFFFKLIVLNLYT